jgi:Dolichyl-phosphate-mannose-protein mannosyltransferase
MSPSALDGGVARSPWFARLPRPTLASAAALLICAVGLVWRLQGAACETSSPLIDENEVVEQAVAFMGGELRYHFLKYGPFTMYVLAGIYRLLAALHGVTSLEYASRVFFDGAEHYFVARAYTAGTLSVLGLVSFFAFRRHYGIGPALLVCTLLGLPFVDALTHGARIDMPQAAFQGMALLALGEVVVRPSKRVWILAGACAGLGIATKPLPGLLILPSFVLASWFAARSGRDGEPRRWAARLGAALASPGAWLAALGCVVLAAAGNPALLDIGDFVESQREAVALHSGNVSWSHQSVGASALVLGLPFVLAVVAAALACLARRDPRGLVVASFLGVYLGAFAGRASRHYYMVAAAVAACLLVGHGFALAIAWATSRGRGWTAWAWLPLAGVLVAPGVASVLSRTSNPPYASIARQWLYDHVPTGTRIVYVGWRGSGPQLVSTNKKTQARWGEHFAYGRDHYQFLKQAFDRGYAEYEQSGRPRYSLALHRDKPLPRGKGMPKAISDSLLKTARAKKQAYIILAGVPVPDVHDLHYRWFDSAILEQQFGGIAIFRVPDAPEAAAAVAAPEPDAAVAAPEAAAPQPM